tara:strand:+ start:136 stop:333 length:198 start_codon:yes stop_codon:yes gene_type:complete
LVDEQEKTKWFHEEWAKEEELLKLGLKVSRRNKEERFNKAPARELVDQIEGRVKNEGSISKSETD